MSGGFPFSFDVCNGNNYTVSSNAGVNTPPSASANTKGSFTQVVASTSVDSVWMVVDLQYYPSTTTTVFVDVAVGAAGSEKVIIQDLEFSCTDLGGQHQASQLYGFPVAIPSGTRISARSQVNNASGDSPQVSVILFDGSFSQSEGYAGVDAIGANESSTIGSTLDPGGVIHTKGAYTQLTASTSRDYVGILAAFDGQNTGTLGSSQSVDIAIGGAGSETVIVPDITFWTSVRTIPWILPFIPIMIPSGTRIAGRCSSSLTGAADRTVGLIVYGVYQ